MMGHIATQSNGECNTPTCECHALATKTIADDHALEINPSELIGLLEATAYKAGERAERARVRAAIFDVLDAGDSDRPSFVISEDCTITHLWVFNENESDDETQRRTRFVDQVCKRLEELG